MRAALALPLLVALLPALRVRVPASVARHAPLAQVARAPVPVEVAPSEGPREALREEVSVPMTFGVLRPCLVLPAAADPWPSERVRAAQDHALGSEAVQAIAASARKLQPDYARGQVLGTLLQQKELAPSLARIVLEEAGRMDGDDEKANVLVSLAERMGVPDLLRAEFLNTARQVGGDGDGQRVLRALTK